MACRFVYKGQSYDQDGLAKALRGMSPSEAAPFIPGVDAMPDPPFKSSWHELSLKRMIRYAAENGYDRISWDTGATNAERYDLSKQIEHITYKKNDDGTFKVSAMLPSGRGHPLGDRLTESQLEDYVGKEVAKKIADGGGERINYGGGGTSQQDWWHTLSGLDLKVGGEGMHGFYDDILPKAANKLGKKYGAKVEQRSLGHEPDKEAFERAMQSGDSAAIGDASSNKKTAVHTLKLTPALRDAAMTKGFPLFARGGRVATRKMRVNAILERHGVNPL